MGSFHRFYQPIKTVISILFEVIPSRNMAKLQSKLLLSATVLLVMFSMANLRYLLIDVLPSNALEKSNDVLTESSDYSEIAEDGTAPCDQIAMESRMTCDNGKCLHLNYVCDNVNHCGDDSDEKDCDGKNARSCYSPDLDCSRTVSKEKCPNVCKA